MVSKTDYFGFIFFVSVIKLLKLIGISFLVEGVTGFYGMVEVLLSCLMYVGSLDSPTTDLYMVLLLQRLK